MRYLICYDATWINKLASAFPTPALRKRREGRGTPPCSSCRRDQKPGPPAYYDQNVGRFVSEDPIRSRGGINFYAYAGNSPVNFVDPLGLERKDPLHVPCNEEEYLDCYDRCGSRGVEICEVTWFWKLRRWQPGKGPGTYTYDWVRGEMNCVCNEPNETCKKLVPGLVPFFVFLEEYGWVFAF